MHHLPRIKSMALNLDTNGVSFTLDKGECVTLHQHEDVLCEPSVLLVHLGTPWECVYRIKSQQQAKVLSAWLKLVPTFLTAREEQLRLLQRDHYRRQGRAYRIIGSREIGGRTECSGRAKSGSARTLRSPANERNDER